MIGLLVVTHCNIGKELLKAAELVMGPLDLVDCISIESLFEAEKLILSLKDKIKALDKGKGVLIMTDMFGGTPCNISIPFMEENKVEVVTGVNLPMLLAVIRKRNQIGLLELSKEAVDEAKDKIYLVKDLLPKR
jgi:PTS system mannose-specific IIA component